MNIRLLERLYNTQVKVPGPHGTEQVTIPKEALDQLNIRITADDVFAMYHESTQEEWHLVTDTGPLFPPYPQMWIEGRLPKSMYAENEWRTFTEDMSTGFQVAWSPLDFGGYEMRIRSFQGVDDVVVHLPFEVIATIDAQGNYIEHKVSGPVEVRPEQLEEIGGSMIWPVVLTVGLMNCKNIATEPSILPPPPVQKKRVQKGFPTLAYSHVKLPKAPRGDGSGQERSGREKALHLVRGHFKTYTEAAPLLGRHTGTWWWGWQAKGSSKNGLRIPRYEVGRPTDGDDEGLE